MKKILIYNSGGGLGDSIQIIPLILSLKNHYRSSDLYYLGAHENHFKNKLKEFNMDIKTLDLDIKYFGFRWWHLFLVKKRWLNKNFTKIDLIVDLQSKLRNTIILKKIPHIQFYSSTFKFKFCTKKKDYLSKNHLENLKKFLDTKIRTYIFDIDKLPNQLKLEAKRLLPNKNYVGFSITQGNKYRKKSWSINNFIDLANKISQKNKTPVFFIEKEKIKLIDDIKLKVPNAIFPEVQSTLTCPALVTALSSRLDIAISIDNGVMHMIGLAKIPMIVLFGPTNAQKFAPKNNLIKVIDSKKIYKSTDINKITVQDVLDNYLSS